MAETNDEELQDLISAGAGITGAMSGVGLGALAGGGIGAMAGALVGPVVTAVAHDFLQRRFSAREKMRVGAVLRFALEMFEERVARGDTVRPDEFLTFGEPTRADGEEILEGMFFAAQREHEERKLPFLGYFYGNLAFEPTIDKGLANWLLREFQDLSWTQLLLLEIVGRKDDLDLPDRTIGRDVDGDWTTWGIDRQLADLGFAKRELIGAPSKRTERHSLSYPNMALRDQVLRSPGRLIQYMFSLGRIDGEELVDIVKRLRKEPKVDSDSSG